MILIVRIRLSQYWKKIDSSLSQSLYKIWDLSAIILWNETCLSTEISMKKCYNLPIFLPQMIFYSPAKLNVKKINKRKRSSLAERWIIMTKDWKIRRMTSFLWTAENKINLHCNNIYERQPISLMVINIQRITHILITSKNNRYSKETIFLVKTSLKMCYMPRGKRTDVTARQMK